MFTQLHGLSNLDKLAAALVASTLALNVYHSICVGSKSGHQGCNNSCYDTHKNDLASLFTAGSPVLLDGASPGFAPVESNPDAELASNQAHACDAYLGLYQLNSGHCVTIHDAAQVHGRFSVLLQHGSATQIMPVTKADELLENSTKVHAKSGYIVWKYDGQVLTTNKRRVIINNSTVTVPLFNRGTDPIEITRPQASCSCISASVDKFVVEPQDKAVVQMRISPSGLPQDETSHFKVYMSACRPGQASSLSGIVWHLVYPSNN